MTTRQEATALAVEWAKEAETQHPTNPARALHAQEIATMWAAIAALLPTVEADQQPAKQTAPHQCCQLCPCTGAKDQPTCNPCCACGKAQPKSEPCDDERANLGALLRPARCILPTGHPMPHRDLTGSTWQPIPQCPSHHAFGSGEHRCERQTGHHGIHTAAGRQWPNTSHPNDTPSSQQRHPDCFGITCQHPHCGDTCPWRKPPDMLLVAPATATVPAQRQHTDDMPPRCPSQRDGERCERAAGHAGIHQGVTCGWRNEPTPAAAPAATSAGACCQRAVAHTAERLLQHARTAPGLTELERRALEDAADFVRAHMPAQAGPEAWCGARVIHGPHTFTVGVGEPVRCPGVSGSPS